MRSVMTLQAAFALIVMAAPALAQQPPNPIAEANNSAYALGLQTGQQVSEMLRAADDRLKWVLDNWVPKQKDDPK